MQPLDLLVLGTYLTAVVWLGAYFSRRQHAVQDYFLSGRRVPWWALLASIVATETSTVTLIGIPGYAFGGDLTFLQLALGYVVARVLVAIVLIPIFFRADRLTAYQYLTERFGAGIGRLSASIFLITRSLSDGFRLFATGLVLATVLASLPTADALPGAAVSGDGTNTVLLVVAIGLIGVTTLAYTLLGGMMAVIWTDVVQLVVYSAGSVLAALILLGEIPGGWSEVVATAGPAAKFTIFDFTLGLTTSYTFWSGLIGGMFLTAATHGTDQLFVQRYLCSRSVSEAQRALILSGVVIFVQFVLFLIIGIMLWVYYTSYAPEVLASLMVGERVQTDRVFPTFMMSHLPTGIRGLLVAAIVAAAMSTLSSSLNSSAASTLGDFYIPLTGGERSDRHYLWVSRWATVGWGVVQIVVALLAIQLSSRVVDEVLGIQSFAGGPVLGAFLLALSAAPSAAATATGVAAGALVLLLVRLFTEVSWQWYALIGAMVTFSVGWLLSRRPAPDASGERP